MKNIILYLLFIISFASCKKQDRWLDVKSNKADIVPKTIPEFQALLDNDGVMNDKYPALGLTSSDIFFVTDALAQTGGSVWDRNAYIWKPDIYEGSIGNGDWYVPYRAIGYANVVIDGLNKIQATGQDQNAWNNAMGSALFFRAFAYYSLANLFCPPYSDATSGSDLGLPLKLTSDVNEKVKRSTVQQTYQRILDDLTNAEPLISTKSLYKTRPCKEALYGLLAKVYLRMEDYAKAGIFSDKAIKENGSLIDFNTLNASLAYPLPTFQAGNPEISFFCKGLFTGISLPRSNFINPDVYNSYDADDLRKTVFYTLNADGTHSFKGTYAPNLNIFCGIAVNELLLIRAECYARNNKTAEALADLNSLLVKRYKMNTGGVTTYVNKTAPNPEAALRLILAERLKELPYTGELRWEDLRRLNKDSRFAKTLTRVVNGITYTLPPNDPRYTFPIVPEEIRINQYPQNIR